MNRRLLDPFQAVALPERIEETLKEGHTTCVELNRRGTLLAAGWADGTVVIYDFETRGVQFQNKVHSEGVVSVTWSRTGYYLASASENGELCLWNVLENRAQARLQVEGRVTRISLSRWAGLHNQQCNVLVSFAGTPPLVYDFGTGHYYAVPLFLLDGGKASRTSPHPASTSDATALYDKHGQFVFVAQPRGSIAVLDASSLLIYEVFKMANVSRLTSMTLNRQGKLLTVTCQDRTVKVLEVVNTEYVHQRQKYTIAELQNMYGAARMTRSGCLINPERPLLQMVQECSLPVDKVPWKVGLVTSDGEHILAAPVGKDNDDHLIYIWARGLVPVSRVLQSAKAGGVVDMVWHPVRNLLISVSTTGEMYIWGRVYRENWSAFAPDFEELAENQEYEEAEDEFDINGKNPMDGMNPLLTVIQDEEVDIVTIDAAKVLSSDDEEDERGLHHVPATVIPQVLPSAAPSRIGTEDEEMSDEPEPSEPQDDVSEPSESEPSEEDEGMEPGALGSEWDTRGATPSEGEISMGNGQHPHHLNHHQHNHHHHDIGNGLMNGLNYGRSQHLLPGGSLSVSEDEGLIGSSRQQQHHHHHYGGGGYIDHDDISYGGRHH